jgi:molecular chaperone GrpE
MDKKTKNMKSDAPPESASPAAVETLLPPVPLTPEQIAELKERAAKAEENWDRFLRQSADFENYKKRAARERQEAAAFANEVLLLKLLPTLDALEMALAAAGTDPASQSLRTGVQMVASQLKTTLAEAGLEEIDAADKMFDPNSHEAVSQQETADVPEGRVLRQIRKGYKFRNRLLRPAGVIVAKRTAP